MCGSLLGAPASALAQATGISKPIETLLLDRAVVRFSAPEGAGRERPYFVYQRELAFEARVIALSDPTHQSRTEPYRRHHLQNALERHVAETLLAALTVQPTPQKEELAAQVIAARKMIVAEIGGEHVLLAAAQAEGLGSLELRRYFRRRAQASLYLHAMVTPMLAPSKLELRRVHRRGEGPLAESSFEEAEPYLRRWLVSRRLKGAVNTFFRNARARLKLEFL